MSYAQLHALASPVLKCFREDLERVDKAMIEEHPCVPYLHWTHASGTHLELLLPADMYPPKGEYVPYLFGVADRHHILEGRRVMAEYFVKRGSAELVLHFDGTDFHKITQERALEIASSYLRAIEREWDTPRIARRSSEVSV